VAATARKHGERVRRSLPARYPVHGAWPGEMRADMAAAFLDYDTSGQFLQAVLQGDAPRPSSERSQAGRREPMWALDVLQAHIANRHQIANDASQSTESIGSLV
jgi:hypothetical protein